MAWKTLTDALVLAEFNDSETSVYNTAKGDDEDAGLATIITGVIDEFRDAIGSRGHALDADGTLPPGFIAKAVALVRWRFLLALPSGTSLLSAERKAANEAGEKLLSDIRDGKVGVVGPNGPATSAAGGSKKRIGGWFHNRNETF